MRRGLLVDMSYERIMHLPATIPRGEGGEPPVICTTTFKNIPCPPVFRKEFGKNNTVHFDSLSENCVVCRICKIPALFCKCPAV